MVCGNAANLLLSRSLVRAREIAIRAALGASTWRLVRQLLVESLLYAVPAGGSGLALAYAGVRAFDAVVPSNGRPYWITFEMDYKVLGFLTLVVMLTGIVFGLAPALSIVRAGVHERLKERREARAAVNPLTGSRAYSSSPNSRRRRCCWSGLACSLAAL